MFASRYGARMLTEDRGSDHDNEVALRRRRRRRVHFPEDDNMASIFGDPDATLEDFHMEKQAAKALEGAGNISSGSDSKVARIMAAAAAMAAGASNSDQDGTSGDEPKRFIIEGIKPAFKLKGRRSLSSRRRIDQRSPAEDAEYVKAQFVLARKTNNPQLLAQVAEKFNMDSGAGLIRKRITQQMVDESLLYSMLSGNEEMVFLLIEGVGATVKGADAVFNENKGELSSCECGRHPGFLLVTLARQGSHRMVELALQGGIDPNLSVCDGEAQCMRWAIAMSIQGVQLIKTPVLRSTFAKSTALTAAVRNNDLAMVHLLLEHGARPSIHNYAAISEAAVVQDPMHQCLSFLLRQFPEDSAEFRDACAVALKAAASRGNPESVQWIIEQLELRQDWGALGDDATKRVRRRRTLLASAGAGTSQGWTMKTAKAAAQALQEMHEDDQIIRQKSSSSVSSSSSSASRNHLNKHGLVGDSGFDNENSCLNASSMREYGARRRSLSTASHGQLQQEIHTGSRKGLHRRQPSQAKVQFAASEDLVTSTVAHAIDVLVDEATQPGYVHRDAFVRGLEGLAHIEQDRCGTTITTSRRVEDLYKIFLNTLEDTNPINARDSVLTLLNVGVESFLNLDGPAPGAPITKWRNRKGQSVRSMDSLSETSDDINGDSSGTSSSSKSGLSRLAAGAWGRVRLGLKKIKVPTTSSSSSSSSKNKERAPRRASGDEQAKALITATKGGHTWIVQHLLSGARPDLRVLVPNLITVAAKENHFDTFKMLLEFMPDDMDEGALRESLDDALVVALESEAMETAHLIMNSGATQDKETFVQAMSYACSEPSYMEESADALVDIMHHADMSFTLDDVKDIIMRTVSCDEPNLYSLATVLDLDESFRTAASPEHLLKLIDSSARNSAIPEWADLTMMLLKCIEDHPDHEDIAAEVYEKATSVPNVHPGVLGVLMRHTDIPEHEDQWV